jgi:hypothetical protein
MTEITINSISGLTPPYSVYVCDVYGNNCILVAAITNTVPPTSVSIVLPIEYNTAPAVMIKLLDSSCCEAYKVIYCSTDDTKQFMSIEDFYFMNNNLYLFQFQ